MKLTLETDYAIRIVDYLVRSGELTGAAEIAELAVVPLRFAKNILQKLAGKGIVVSYKGIHGGYKLEKPPKEVSLYDVIEAIEGPLVFNRCLLESYECNCTVNKQCPYYDIFHQLSTELEDRMRAIRFGTVILNHHPESQMNIAGSC